LGGESRERPERSITKGGDVFFREKKESWKDFVLKKKEEGNRERERVRQFF
jgi:hypothetical protein